MLYSVFFFFSFWSYPPLGCAAYILYSKISTDLGLLKIRHSQRFVAVVIQFLIPLSEDSSVFFAVSSRGAYRVGCQVSILK